VQSVIALAYQRREVHQLTRITAYTMEADIESYSTESIASMKKVLYCTHLFFLICDSVVYGDDEQKEKFIFV